MTKTKAGKPVYRKFWFWLVVLVVIYALAGFLLLPWWLQRQLPQQLEQHMGWQAQVEDIRTNPFRLSVDARALTADDRRGERVLAFDRLYVDIGFWKLFTGVVGLQSIELDEPFVRLDLLEDHSVNIVKDWHEANEPSGDERSAPRKFHLRQLVVDGGELLFRDYTQEQPAEFRITPLDLNINNLVTWRREESSSYHLQAALGSQTLDWEGQLSINPLYSHGRLRVADLDHATLGHVLAPYLPYTLRAGTATASTDYELRLADQFYLTTANGALTLDQVALALDKDREDTALKSGQLSVDEVHFDLSRQLLELGVIKAKGLDLALARNGEGAIDLFAVWPSTPASGAAEHSSAEKAPLQWSVAGVELANSRLRWQDAVPEHPADVLVEGVALSLGTLTHELAEPVRYRVEGAQPDGGSLAMNGQVTMSPFTLEAGMNASAVSLEVLEPYLRELANLDVRNGFVALDGNLDLDGQQDPLTGTFSGTGELSELNLTLPDSDEPLLSWQTLRLAPVEYNVHPARLEIGTITLSEPAVNLVRGGEGQYNVEDILRTGDDAGDDEGDVEGAESDSDEKRDFIFRIEQLILEQGELSYTDQTLTPEFATTIEAINGSVTGASNISPQEGRVSLAGKVEGQSDLAFEGTLGTLGTDAVSRLTLSVQDASLANLSPYFGRYLGYSVEGGQLDLEMNYEFVGTRLDAANLIVLDGLELGEAVDSDEAVDVPVRLGLALLSDRDGEIEIDLPVSGDLSDPAFNMSGMVMRGMVNLIRKAATSPFSVLGSVAKLAGLSDDELREINFIAGTVELSEGEQAKLEALAEVLKTRPALTLTIRGAASPEADRQPPDALAELASERGNWLKRQLVEEYNVDLEQVSLTDPVRDAKADKQGVVAARFDLDAR